MTELLIATHNALVLWSNGRELVLHTGEGAYYGITWSPDQLFVVARGNQPSRMRAFAANMWPLDDLPFVHMGQDDDGPHQALWWDGVLYVTNTQRNRVEMVKDGVDAVEYLAWGQMDGDHDHINSIWRDPDDGIFYVVKHRKQERPKRIRVLDGDLNLLDTIEIDLDCLVDGPTHCGLHNVYVEDGLLITLGPSQIILVDCNEKADEFPLPGVVKNRHYLRGLARSPDYFFVGVSAAMPRGERHYGPSRILVLDSNLTVLDEIHLSREFGQIMEIRIVNAPDEAHNGVPCPLWVIGEKTGAR